MGKPTGVSYFTERLAIVLGDVCMKAKPNTWNSHNQLFKTMHLAIHTLMKSHNGPISLAPDDLNLKLLNFPDPPVALILGQINPVHVARQEARCRWVPAVALAIMLRQGVGRHCRRVRPFLDVDPDIAHHVRRVESGADNLESVLQDGVEAFDGGDPVEDEDGVFMPG